MAKTKQQVIDTAELKTRIHHLTNCTQAVLGYMELGEYAKAVGQIKECILEMRTLAKLVARLHPAAPENVQPKQNP